MYVVSERDEKPPLEDQLSGELIVPERLPGETAEEWARRINEANGYEPRTSLTPATQVDGVKPYSPDEWDHVRTPYGND